MMVFSSDKSRVSIADLRTYMHEVLLATAVFGIMIVCGSAVSIALDIRALRVSQEASSTRISNILSSHLNSFEWKSDTFLKLATSFTETLPKGLMQIRVQVRQSSDDQERAIKSVAANTEKAVQKTLEGAGEAMQQTPAPIINVQSAKPIPVEPPRVVVNPLLSDPHPLFTKQAETSVDEPTKSRWGWIKHLWPFHHHARTEK